MPRPSARGYPGGRPPRSAPREHLPREGQNSGCERLVGGVRAPRGLQAAGRRAWKATEDVPDEALEVRIAFAEASDRAAAARAEWKRAGRPTKSLKLLQDAERHLQGLAKALALTPEATPTGRSGAGRPSRYDPMVRLTLARPTRARRPVHDR